jgi:hypothetical protein
METNKGTDRNACGMAVNNLSDVVLLGEFNVWTTRGGLPVAGLENADGTKLYRTHAKNTASSALLNMLRDITWKIAVWNAGSPAGGLWTTGPYIGLVLSAQPIAAATTLSTRGTFEASGNGYTARQLPTWTADTTGKANGSQVSWTASGGNLGGAALGQLFTTPAATTDNTGAGTAPNTMLMTFATLNGGPFTIATGNTFNVTYSHIYS